MKSNHKIQSRDLLNLAEEMGNVSKVCKVMCVSRDTYYRHQESCRRSDRTNGSRLCSYNDGITLSDAQVAALEKKKHDDEACGEIELLIEVF